MATLNIASEAQADAQERVTALGWQLVEELGHLDEALGTDAEEDYRRTVGELAAQLEHALLVREATKEI